MAIQLENYVPALKYGGVVNAANDIALTQNYILVGDSNGLGTEVALSGDATLVAGAITIASGAVTRTKMSTAAASKQAEIVLENVDTAAASYYGMTFVPETGTLAGIKYVAGATLAANDTNYVTVELINAGQAGVGTTAMLAASNANTSKATGGSAITVGVPRALTLHGTPANLAVTKGDLIMLKITVTGTLANAVPSNRVALDFTGTT